MVRFYLGEEPIAALRRRPTTSADPEVARRRSSASTSSSIKPRDGSGGHGVVVGPARATAATRERARAVVRDDPEGYVAQETVRALAPPDRGRRPRSSRATSTCAVRLPARRDDAAVLAGGLTRVALDEGALVVNSSQNGGAKDTWVLA